MELVYLEHAVEYNYELNFIIMYAVAYSVISVLIILYYENMLVSQDILTFLLVAMTHGCCSYVHSPALSISPDM